MINTLACDEIAILCEVHHAIGTLEILCRSDFVPDESAVTASCALDSSSEDIHGIIGVGCE